MILKNLGKIVLLFVFFQVLAFGRFELVQTISKDTIYLNETIKVTLKLSFENNESEVIDLVDFEEYESIDFWKKLHTNQTKKLEGSKWIYTYEYLLEPKKTGSFILPKQLLKVSSYQIRQKKRFIRVYSNELHIKVLPLVDNIPIQGDYTIKFSVDKTQIKPNESIRGKLFIEGTGNLKDIKPYELKLDEQTVFSDAIERNTIFTNNSYEGNVSQDFLIISDTSFTIPSFDLKYYNPALETIEIKQTDPIFVEVIQKANEKKDEPWMKYLFLSLGIFMGIIIFLYYKKSRDILSKKQKPFYQSVKNTKNKKELYDLLIKHNHTQNFTFMIKELERDIYTNSSDTRSFKEIKKEVLQLLLV